MSSEAKREVWVQELDGVPLCVYVRGQHIAGDAVVRYIPEPSTPAAKGHWEALAKYASETTGSIQPSWHGEKRGWTIDMMCDDAHHGGGYGPTLDTAAVSLCERLGLPLPTPAAKAGDGWIRCSDSTPRVAGMYLVWHQEHGCDVFFHDSKSWGKSSFFDHEDPTHWMPLPAPPSPETNGEA